METRELLRGNTGEVAAPVPHKTDMRVEFADMCRIYFLCFWGFVVSLSCFHVPRAVGYNLGHTL